MANTRKELKVSDQDRWYLVGLIAADGCLSSDGRHINITSKDYDFLARLTISLGLSSKVGTKNKGQVNQASRALAFQLLEGQAGKAFHGRLVS